jgi:hypothetical protein
MMIVFLLLGVVQARDVPCFGCCGVWVAVEPSHVVWGVHNIWISKVVTKTACKRGRAGAGCACASAALRCCAAGAGAPRHITHPA